MSNEPFLRIAQHLQLQTGNAGEWVDKNKWFHLLGNDFTILQNAPQAPVAQETKGHTRCEYNGASIDTKHIPIN